MFYSNVNVNKDESGGRKIIFLRCEAGRVELCKLLLVRGLGETGIFIEYLILSSTCEIGPLSFTFRRGVDLIPQLK